MVNPATVREKARVMKEACSSSRIQYSIDRQRGIGLGRTNGRVLLFLIEFFCARKIVIQEKELRA